MQNLAPCVLDNKEAIQHAEAYGRHGKEIHSGEDFTVILQKANLSMANWQIGLSALFVEVLIPLPGCATSLSYSFI